MSIMMEEEIKRWTAKRKTALVMDIIQGKTTVSEAARAFDLAPSEIEEWVNDAKQGMENALRAKPLDIREQYEKQLKELQDVNLQAKLIHHLHRILIRFTQSVSLQDLFFLKPYLRAVFAFLVDSLNR